MKGDKFSLTKYRPIYILTSFSKVFEKALYRRLTVYFDTNKLLVTNQYGFQKRQATDDAIFKLINEIIEFLNNKMKTGSIFCDLQKHLTQ
jgi:hypothetical protein